MSRFQKLVLRSFCVVLLYIKYNSKNAPHLEDAATAVYDSINEEIKKD